MSFTRASKRAMAQRSLLEMADLLGKTQQAKRHLAEFDALMESLRPRFAAGPKATAARDFITVSSSS